MTRSRSGSRRIRTTPRELAGQLAALALALWTVAAVNTITPTAKLRSGQIRGTDFVQFYALGRLAATGGVNQFDNFDAIRQNQLAGVPESTSVWFPPVYGPQVVFALAPLGKFSYGVSLALWVSFSAVLYFAICRFLIIRTDRVSSHRGVALLAALAFPAFWQLLQHGQLTIVAMSVLVAAWVLLRHEHPRWAGAVLGLLVYKPPFLVPVLAVLLVARAWQVLLPTVASAALEVGATSLLVGVEGLRRYILMTLNLPRMSGLLFTNPAQSHGLKAFWMLLVPQPTLVLALYALSAGAVVVLASGLWRCRDDATWRMMVMLLAISLVSPYVFVYDLAILAPAWIWLTDWFLTHEVPAGVGRVLYLGYLAPLAAPVVPFIHIQPSIPCLIFLLVALWRYRKAPVIGTTGLTASRPDVQSA
jgi:hypothetical protein